MSFAEFVANVYSPVVLPKLATSTRYRYRGIISKYLTPHFDHTGLSAINVLAVDRFLTTVAGANLTHESLDKIRDVLSGILSAAVLYGYLDRNPARGLRLPKSRSRRGPKPFITPGQLAAIVDAMAEPYATMVFTAAWTGLRVSELVALRWRNVGSDSITVAERYCRGEWGDSKPLHDDHLAVVEHDAGRAAWEANCSLSPRCDPIEGLARIAKNTKVKSN